MTALKWQKAVIKVGSSLLAAKDESLASKQIAAFIRQSRAQGKEIILVSSGAVAAGREHIKVAHQPSIAEKQAMAAIGQTRMFANWAAQLGEPCAQLLLSYGDLIDRERYVNIKNTLRELLRHGALPIVNENDSVAVNELKVGDNDNLAAYTALVAEADLLVMCSDVAGLYNANPRTTANAQLIPEVSTINEDTFALAGGAGTSMGTGGMLTKLQAAQKCAAAGITSVLFDGHSPEAFTALQAGQNPGTCFIASASKDSAKRKWLKHTLPTGGYLEIDAGAYRALVNKGASLLPSGVIGIQGDFKAGDAVQIQHNRQPLAKGFAQYNSQEMQKIKGLHSQQISQHLGYCNAGVAVHRDDLVWLEEQKDHAN